MSKTFIIGTVAGVLAVLILGGLFVWQQAGLKPFFFAQFSPTPTQTPAPTPSPQPRRGGFVCKNQLIDVG